MAKITVKIVGDQNLAIRELGLVKRIVEEDLREIAVDTVFVMRDNIRKSIQRPGSTDTLAQGFFQEKIPNGYGVGNISHLDQFVPYWRWVNFGIAKSGRTTPPPTGGYFTPGTTPPSAASFRQGRFVRANNSFFIMPTRPIQAHNFIARTLQQTNSIITKVLQRRRKF